MKIQKGYSDLIDFVEGRLIESGTKNQITSIPIVK